MLDEIDADTLSATQTVSATAVVECDASMLRIPTRLEWVDRTAHFLRRRAEHCGACDHSCLGCECVAGKCQPVEVIEGLAPGQEYAAAGAYVLKADLEKAGASHDH